MTVSAMAWIATGMNAASSTPMQKFSELAHRILNVPREELRH